MDTFFEANRLHPDDPNYVWDKRVDFHPGEESCEWDDEESDDD